MTTCTSSCSLTTTTETLDWNVISSNMIDKKIDSNQYQLIEELGRGSYGCLFLGQHLSTNDYVAIKILSKRGLNPSELALQQLEMDLQLQLAHTNILSLHHVVQGSEYIFMIMELCDGGDLFEFVVSSKQKEDECVLKDMFLQILDAVEYMHTKGIYHRDIKLENILLQSKKEKEEGFFCKVADFGLATNQQWSLEFGCGSTTYLAPEHFGAEEEAEAEEEDKPYDAAAGDIWSLGILLLALLFGRNPWQEATLMDPSFAEFTSSPDCLKYDLFPSLSNQVLSLLKQVLCVDPVKRLEISQLKQQFQLVTKLYQEDYDSCEEEEEEETAVPMDILPVQATKNTKASYDSAIFSCQDTTSGYSWSDMVEEDLLLMQQQKQVRTESKLKQPLDDSSYIEDTEEEEEHDDIFIHVQEKESWWL